MKKIFFVIVTLMMMLPMFSSISSESFAGEKTVNGVCGSSSGKAFTSKPASNLCKSGNPSKVSGSGPWSWTCKGSGKGSTSAECQAKLMVNGVCGSSDGQYLDSIPTSNLCQAGTATAVTQSKEKLLWSCNGTNGGTNASCNTHYSGGGDGQRQPLP